MTQTNYNERLDEIFHNYELRSVKGGTTLEDAQSAITQLFKDLVAEAKPAFRLDKKGHFPKDKSQDAAFNAGITQFEYNLLKRCPHR